MEAADADSDKLGWTDFVTDGKMPAVVFFREIWRQPNAIPI